jgi:UDP-N-acetylmuramate dehydrogenase
VTVTTGLRDLARRVRGTVRFDEPLARYTTYRIGGPAAAVVLAASVEDVATAVTFAGEAGTRWLAIGLGSNLLVADDGFDGIAIRLGKGLDRLESNIDGEPQRWRAEAGLPTPLLARRTAEEGGVGAQRLVGVPGTVGGGVYMNAGAHGQDFATLVRSVEVVEDDGTVHSVAASEIPWRYRGSGLERRIVVSATVQLTPEDPAVALRDLTLHLRKRREGTPFNEPCCGSVFRNPASVPGHAKPPTAGQLIDALGFKGFRIGGARVSPVHANYIVNDGGATARDVLAVIEAVQERALRELGVRLELEVQLIG